MIKKVNKNSNESVGAWICINDEQSSRKTRGRVKVLPEARSNSSQTGTIYLKDNQEFEIELYNPLKTVIKAEIKLNGEFINSGGIVLNPGERIYLDCNPETRKKFMYRTYNIEDTIQNRSAIENNGLVEVFFYDETVYNNFWNHNWTYNTKNNWGTGTIVPRTTTDLHYCTNSQINNLTASLNNNLETGRVEEGANSEQLFETVYKSFNSFYMFKTEYKILPISNKPLSKKDIEKNSVDNCVNGKISENYTLSEKIDMLEKIQNLRSNGIITKDQMKKMKDELDI